MQALEALTDPRVWYAAEGDEKRLRAHRTRMIESCRRFLDFESLESTPMSHYRLRD